MPPPLLPPGPKYWLYGAAAWAFQRDPLNFLTRNTREFGDVVHFSLGSRRMYFFNRPEYVAEILVTQQDAFMKGQALQRAKRVLGEGLLTSEGATHLRQRRLVQPAFQRQRLPAYAGSMVQCAARAAERWQDGQTLNMHAEMLRLALRIAGETLFGADVEHEAAEIGAALTELMEAFDLVMLPFSQWLEWLPLPRARRFKRAIARLDSTIQRLIDERRRNPRAPRDSGDLLSMLLNARDAEGGGGGMSDRQLRDEALTLFLAGHETTANAMTWTWYLLSQNPAIETQLHAELQRVLPNGRLPEFADLPELRFVENIFAESLRLFPPAWAIGRMALRDVSVGGYTMPKGAIALLSPYVTQRDARYFPDPQRFDPERWTPAAKEARHPFAYFPFGGGARRCIGEGFAWMEGTLLLATLAQRWRFTLDPKQIVATQPVITLRPRHGMNMLARKISD